MSKTSRAHEAFIVSDKSRPGSAKIYIENGVLPIVYVGTGVGMPRLNIANLGRLGELFLL